MVVGLKRFECCMGNGWTEDVLTRENGNVYAQLERALGGWNATPPLVESLGRRHEASRDMLCDQLY